MTSDRFGHSIYLVRKRVLSVIGGKFEIFDQEGNVVLFSKMAAFKLKEDIRLFTDDSMTTELISIKARSIMDFSAAYDVVDTATGQKIGALKRKGWKSMFRDEWIIMDAYDTEVGGIQEENAFLAFLRRFVTNLIPQTYNVQIGGTSVAEFKQNFNPFVTKLTLDFSPDRHQKLDRRLGIAAGVLLCAIEGKQEN
ncbi:MAG TPA: hypothetical protein PLK30_07655 [Blastocatellia bacterium]|nr:hypothetical protein [Blastocatellia bacterium]